MIKDTSSKEVPLAFLASDEGGSYFGINPEQLTDAKLFGEDSTTYFREFAACFVEGNKIKFQPAETQKLSYRYIGKFQEGHVHLDENKEFRQIVIEEGEVFAVKQDQSTFILMQEENGDMYWQHVKNIKIRLSITQNLILCSLK